MKKAAKLLCCVLFAVFLIGCSGQGLSNKSMVKAILIDVYDNKYKASIVMLTCEPSSQIADIKESAAVYTAVSEDLEVALINAERQQSKSAFYAQNELLLINYDAVEKFDAIIKYFKSENCARPGMTIYLTQNTEADFKSSEKYLPKIINNIETINVLNNEYKQTRVYDTIQTDNSFSAVIPTLKIDDKDGSCNIINMAIVANNKITAKLTGNEMAVAIILLQRSKAMRLTENNKNIEINNLNLSNEIQNCQLNIYITGNIKAWQKDREANINQIVAQHCTQVYNDYFASIDVLQYDWWFSLHNIKEIKKVNFITNLKNI